MTYLDFAVSNDRILARTLFDPADDAFELVEVSPEEAMECLGLSWLDLTEGDC